MKSTRRQVLSGIAAAGFVSVSTEDVIAQAWNDIAVRIERLVGGARINAGRVKVEIPDLAENGNLVAAALTVESPMTEADHVVSIHLFSERNPIATLASFYLFPSSGRAEVKTNIRLAATQHVVALARMNDGSWWSATRPVKVTLAACVDGG